MTPEEKIALKESMDRHKGALERLGHTCDLIYHGIHKNYGKDWEVFICRYCGREEWREYTGTQDTIEGGV